MPNESRTHESKAALLEKVATWHGTPSDQREPKTMKDFAAQIGISAPYCSVLIKQCSNRAKANAIQQTESNEMGYYQPIIRALRNKALKGDAAAARAWHLMVVVPFKNSGNPQDLETLQSKAIESGLDLIGITKKRKTKNSTTQDESNPEPQTAVQ